MGFDRRFTLVLAAWIAALFAGLLVLGLALLTPGLAAARIVAALAVAGLGAGLWHHVERTNRIIARFVEALRFGEFTSRFNARGGAGFDALGAALDLAMRTLQAERDQAARELRFLEALVDDVPIAVLTVDAVHGVGLANKAARQLLSRHEGTRPEDFAVYGSTFAALLAQPIAGRQQVIILRLPAGPQRTIIRAAALDRLGLNVRAITVEPVQGTLDAVEMAAQTDLVRVLTHEILNSLTPVTSLAGTAASVLDADLPDIAAARTAITTLARRAEGLRSFIESYRAIARPPELRPQRFAALPFAEELVRLIGAEWPALPLATEVTADLVIEADPDLLAQALINLLRNAAQAVEGIDDAAIRFVIVKASDGRIAITVEDNGPGVPEALRRDVFLPFFTTREKGTGVGLNLVRQIIVAHGGTIDIGDAASGGATFHLAF